MLAVMVEVHLQVVEHRDLAEGAVASRSGEPLRRKRSHEIEHAGSAVAPFTNGTTEITIAEVPSIVVVELEPRLGAGCDLTHPDQHAFGLARFKMRRDLTERPVLVIRAPVLIVRNRLQELGNLRRRFFERGDELRDPAGRICHAAETTGRPTISAMTGTTATRSPLTHWSGWLPLAIPIFLLALGARYVAIHGLVSQVDEGTEAHLFQLLMPVQLVVMGYFALTWLPRAPRAAFLVLALQAVAVAAVFVAVYSIDHAPVG